MQSGPEQNGRPPLPGQVQTSRPLPDPRFANRNIFAFGSDVEICRDFIWGTCTKSSQCKFRHELDFEEMKKVLRFCHDHQNRSGCNREDCTYLHTTKEEENLFLATGQLPRVLAERHANMMAAAASAISNSPETISQIQLFIEESSYVNARAPPPPPPPPAVPVTAAVQPVVPPAALPPNLSAMPSVIAPAVPPIYLGHHPPPMYQMPPPAFPMIDVSKPPPPIRKPQPPVANNYLPTDRGTTKRKFACEASSSKLRKEGDYIVIHDDELCTVCIQRMNRIDHLKSNEATTEESEQFEKFTYKKSKEKYETIKFVVRAFVPQDVLRILDEKEGAPKQLKLPDILEPLNEQPVQGMSKVLMSVMDYMFNNPRQTTAPPVRMDDAILQKLATISRWNSPLTPSPKSPSQDFFTTLSDIVRKSSPSSTDIKFNPTEGLNGYRYKGQNGDSKVAVKKQISATPIIRHSHPLPRGPFQQSPTPEVLPIPPHASIHYVPQLQPQPQPQLLQQPQLQPQPQAQPPPASVAAPTPSTYRPYSQPPNHYQNHIPAPPYYQGGRMMPPIYATRPNAPPAPAPAPAPTINSNVYAGPPRHPPPPPYYQPYQ